MSVPTRKRKPDVLTATRVWLQIYAVVVEALMPTIEDPKIAHSIAANAASNIMKEIDLGD